MPLDVWNQYDEGSIMPVITPCYPSMNSSHNVSPATLEIILEEFKRGEKIIENIEKKLDVWDSLFEPLPFFSYFPHFIQVHIFSKSPADLRSLKGFFESKIKILTKVLEESLGLFIFFLSIKIKKKIFFHAKNKKKKNKKKNYLFSFYEILIFSLFSSYPICETLP